MKVTCSLDYVMHDMDSVSLVFAIEPRLNHLKYGLGGRRG